MEQWSNGCVSILQIALLCRPLVTNSLLEERIGDNEQNEKPSTLGGGVSPLTFDKTESQTIVGYRGEGMPTSTDLLQGTLELAGKGLNLYDEFWGKKSGGDPDDPVLPARRGGR
jgi:hypothetical protein